MGLVLNDDEKMMQDTAESFFRDRAPVTELRKLRDAQDETGYSDGLWSEMGEMGFAGVLIPEDHGGVEMGFMTAGLVAEQMGRNLSASPWFSTSVLAATALKHAGTEAQKSEFLPKIVAASTVIAVAIDEGAKHNPDRMDTVAEASGNGYRLRGSKVMVVDGHVADHLIVAAKLDGKVALFLIDAKTDGVTTERTQMVDSRNAARIELDADIPGDALMSGGEAMDAVLSAGRAILAAELLGAGGQAFGDTVAYLKERKQFGRAIGEFQALQHRASHLYSELEIARSAVYAALTSLDEDHPDAHRHAAMAKAKLGQVAKLAALEGVQMFGGVGMTDEYDIGLYLKRVRVLQEMLGDENYHADKIARADNY